VVWHLSLPLMNSFNKTEAAVFSFRPCFLGASFSSVYYFNVLGPTFFKLRLSKCLNSVIELVSVLCDLYRLQSLKCS